MLSCWKNKYNDFVSGSFFFFFFKLLEVVKLILCLLFDEALMVKENGQEVVQYQEQN